MLPVFTLFGKEISAYMITSILGALAMLAFGFRESKKAGIDDSQMVYMMVLSAIGILLGGHLLYGITMWDQVVYVLHNLDKIKDFNTAIKCIQTIFGGSVYYGGLIGVFIVCLIFCKVKKLDRNAYFDVGAAAIPLFHFFGRIGCFINGCCYGVESNFGVVYKYSVVEACNGVRRLPIQLFEAVLNLGLFFLLWYFLRKKRFKGKLMALYCLIYPVYRFILEYFRGDEYRGFLGSLSTSQFISILFIVTTVTILVIEKVRGPKKTDSVESVKE